MKPDPREIGISEQANNPAPAVPGGTDSGRSEDWVNNQRYGARQGWDNTSSYGTDWEEEADTLWDDSARSSEGKSSEIGPQKPSLADARLRDRVIAALTDNTALEITNLQVFVENGQVTLTGEVKIEAEQRSAEETAASSADVQHVFNRLTVKQRPGAPLPDGDRKQGQRQDPPA